MFSRNHGSSKILNILETKYHHQRNRLYRYDSRMPFLVNDDIRIYYEIEGTGPPVVLVHGFSSDLTNWKETKWVKILKNKYQVIMLDCRGHGKSDKPHEITKYGLNLMNSDIISLLDTLEIEKANFFGYSMGASLLFQLLLREPNRFISAILGGFVLNFLEDEAERKMDYESVIQIIEALRVDDINQIKDPLAHAFRLVSEKAGNDLIALAAIQEAALNDPCDWEADPELTRKKLKKNRIPILTAIGSNDFIPGDPTLVTRLARKACHFQIYGKNHLNMLKASQFKLMVNTFLNDINNIS